MNVFHKVTLATLKKNRTRTSVTIIGIILSAAMICAVTTFAVSLMGYSKDVTIYKSGNWHGMEEKVPWDMYEKIVDSEEVKGAVYLQQLGYANAEGCTNEFKPYIYLLGAGDGVQDYLPIHITSGIYPTSETEILLPEHLYTNGGIQYRLGDTVTLALGERLLDGYPMTQNNPCYNYDEEGKEVRNAEEIAVRETRTYTVVGFYERLSWDIEPIVAPGYTAITLADQKAGAGFNYDVYFCLKNPKQIDDFMSRLKFGGTQNGDLLMYSGVFAVDGFSIMLISLAGIVIALIMFGSVALIYNAFSISVSERTKQFGILSSVGATKRQLRRMVFFEAFTVSAIGIPLGIVSGVGGIGLTLCFIAEKLPKIPGYPGTLRLRVSFASLVIAALVALVTVLISAWIPSRRATKVSAVEAIRQTRDVSVRQKEVRTSKLAYRLFGLPGVLADKHYKRSRKKYRATIVSLFMSIVLFISASAFTDYLMETVTGTSGTTQYDLSLLVSGEEFTGIRPEELLERMQAAKSVTDGAYTLNRNKQVVFDRADVTKEGAEALTYDWGYSSVTDAVCKAVIGFCFVDDASYDQLLKENRLNGETYKNPEAPCGIVVDGISRYSIVQEKFQTVTYFNKDDFYITVENEGESGTEAATLHISGVLKTAPFFSGGSMISVIYPVSMAPYVLGDYEPEGSYHYTLLSDNHAESYTAVKNLLDDNGFVGKALVDEAADEEQERNFVSVIRVFSYGFIVLISLIAAANVFNTISTNISLRRREFAMLKSVGMTQKDFHKMMNFECILYGSRALLYGLPVSCGVTYLIYRSIMEGYATKFRLPWTAIGIAVLSVFFVVGATMMYAMGKVKKDNPIDALKNENL